MQVVGMTFPRALAMTRLVGAPAYVHHSLATHAQTASSLALSPSSMTQLVGAMNAHPITASATAARAINNVLIMAASFRLLNASLSAGRRMARPIHLGPNAPWSD